MNVAFLPLVVLLAGPPAAGVPLPPPPSLPEGAGSFRAAPPPVRAPSQRGLRVGVPEPATVGEVPPREVAVVAQALVTEVRKLEGLTGVGIAEIREMLTQEYRRQMLGCDVNQECLAEIAGALGVDELVSSQLVIANGTTTFTVSRIDMRSTSVKSDVQRRLKRSGRGEEVLGAIGEVVAALFPERTPRAGTTRGVAPEVARWLNPPPVRPWVFWSTAAVAALAAAGGAAYGLQSNATRAEHNALVQKSTTEEVPGSQLVSLHDQAQSQTSRSALLFGIASGFALAAGVEAVFTDWHDDRARVKIGPGGAAVAVRF